MNGQTRPGASEVGCNIRCLPRVPSSPFHLLTVEVDEH